MELMQGQPVEQLSPILLSSMCRESNSKEKSVESDHVSKSDNLKSIAADVEEGQWAAKTKERQLVRERGTLLKETRELHHSANIFNRAKLEDAKDHFSELQQKITNLSKLHHGSYQLSKRNTLNRIESNRKSIQNLREDGRKREMYLTTTEERYQSILNAMDQIMIEAEQLGMQFEKKLRDKAKEHHDLGNQLKEVGAQLRLERTKKDKHVKDEEKRKREEALERLSQWRESEVVNQQLKMQLQTYEKNYLDKTRKLGKELRDMDHTARLQQREYGRKLQDVNCLLAKVGEEQKKLSENKIHIENQGIINVNEKRVQDHVAKQKAHVSQRQTKANKWQPKLAQLAKENEKRLDNMERQILFEGVAKAGVTERTLFRKMRGLESETRKQEQICNSKRAALEASVTAARKQSQDQLRANDDQHKEMSEQVAKQEALLRQLIVQRDNALAEYREHQTGLKDVIQLFQTLSSEQERKARLSQN